MFVTATQADPGDVFGVFVPLMLFYGFLFVFAIANYVLLAIFLSKVFVKTGNEGWPAWVPIYNSWRILEIAGFQGWISLLSFVPFANIVALVYLIMAVNRINNGFGKSAGWTVLYVFLPLIWGALMGYGRTEPWRGVDAGVPTAYPGYQPVPQAQPYPGVAQPYPGAQPYPSAPVYPAAPQGYQAAPQGYPTAQQPIADPAAPHQPVVSPEYQPAPAAAPAADPTAPVTDPTAPTPPAAPQPTEPNRGA